MATTTGRATDFITFSRASLGTVTGSDGKVKWAGHNLLQNSEQFDASAWVRSNAPSITANNVVAPNGTTTADTIAASAVNISSSIYQSVSLTIGTVVFLFYVKAGTATQMTAGLYSGGFASSTAEIVSGPGTVTGSAEITVTGLSTTQWTCVRMTVTIATAAAYFVYIYPDSGLASGKSIALWGAHLYRSDLGGMVLNPSRGDAYYPTTPKNLLGYSEDFSAAPWGKLNVLAFGSGSISNAIVAPNGLQTADKIVASTATGYHQVAQSIALGSGVNTITVYAKAAEYSLLHIADGNGGVFQVSFNLATGTVVAGSSGSKLTSSNIVSVGDGWYRCVVVVTGVSATIQFAMIGYPAGATLGGYGAQYTGDGTSGIYLWGAQLSDSASLDAYSANPFAAPTAAAYNAPRLDYDPSTLAAKGLLVEEQRTNLLTYSADFSNWPKSLVTITSDYATSPDGTASADRYVTTGGAYPQIAKSAVLTAGTAYAFSVWVKSDGTTPVQQNISLEGASVSFTPTSTWTRITLTLSSSAGGSQSVVLGTLIPSAAANSFLIWGAQLEAGSFATSYIPTTSASSTRAADIASVATSAFPYSASESTLVAAFDFLGYKASAVFTAVSVGANSNNLMRLYQYSNTNLQSGAFIGYSSMVGGSFQADVNIKSTPAVGVVYKAAATFKENDFAGCADGGTVGTDASGSIPSSTTLGIGSDPSGQFLLNGHIRQITYIPRRLTNAELQARTV